MRELNQVEWHAELRKGFECVFRDADPFEAPLRHSVMHRALLYPVPYLLERDQFDSVIEAARKEGDDSFCVSITEGADTLAGRSERIHWIFDYWEYEEYRDLQIAGVLENAVYSPNGKWGMLVSQEQHAIVGGSASFIRSLSNSFPNYGESASAFTVFWNDLHRRAGIDVGWLRPVLAHVYDDERADALLADAAQVR
jgi:hypothetical protein